MGSENPGGNHEIAAPLPDYMRWEALSPLVGSWSTTSLVAYPSNIEECQETMAFCRRNGLTICPRGSGHSYGDQALNDRHLILNTSRMNRILHFDVGGGHMVVQPGVRILDIYRMAHPHLFVLPASPSEATITVAGAIANNVNGKDSWRSGNFGDQVLHVRLLTGSGEILSIDREENGELFRVVVGGMGLLGIIVEATIRLQRISSPFLRTTRIPVDNVRELLDHLALVETESDFAVAWLDVYPRGKNLGRGVVHSTRWSPGPVPPGRYSEEISSGLRRLEKGRRKAVALYRVLGCLVGLPLLAQRVTVPLFNRTYHAFSRVRERIPFLDSVELFIEYNFFPNLVIPPAAIICGPRGYTVQLLIPREEAADAIPDLIRICREFPCPPVTTIMRLHRGDDHTISFSGDGYSLNFEFHPKRRHEGAMRPSIDALLDCAIRYRGKVHLAKDMILKREQFRTFYPGHVSFLEVKRRLDPDGLFASDMYRRLFGSGPDRARNSS